MSQSTRSTKGSLPHCSAMLGSLTIPPRLLARALEDLHAIATQMGDIPRSEDELADNIAALRIDIEALNARAASLEESVERVQVLLKKLPGV